MLEISEPIELTADTIKNIRERLCRTQAGMATILGTTISTISRWERGDAVPLPVYQEKLRRLWEFVQNLKEEEF